MNIIYASNNAYAKYLGISMLSLFDNNHDLEEINVFILAQEIDLENTNHLRAIADKYQRNVKFIDISEFDKLIPFEFGTSGYNPIVLSRLFLCRFLPPASAAPRSALPGALTHESLRRWRDWR